MSSPRAGRRAQGGSATSPRQDGTPGGPVGADHEVEVRRSRRRRRTVSAYREGGRTIVLIPAAFTRAQEHEWVATMLQRLERQESRRRPSDDRLAARATELSGRYLGGRARASSVTWVTNQNSRWGSCTPLDGTIRISSRLRGMPTWVQDYVLLHELAHLLQPHHGPEFWALLQAYPRTERARGFLEGVSSVQGGDGLGPDQDGDDIVTGGPPDAAAPGRTVSGDDGSP